MEKLRKTCQSMATAIEGIPEDKAIAVVSKIQPIIKEGFDAVAEDLLKLNKAIAEIKKEIISLEENIEAEFKIDAFKRPFKKDKKK
jgi:uncharacterized protein YqgV (UPF0045/DUF77 family)